MKYDAAFVKIDKEIHSIIVEAYVMHGRSYHALAKTLNFKSGRNIKLMIQGDRKYICKNKLEMLRCLVEHGDGT